MNRTYVATPPSFCYIQTDPSRTKEESSLRNVALTDELHEAPLKTERILDKVYSSTITISLRQIRPTYFIWSVIKIHTE